MSSTKIVRARSSDEYVQMIEQALDDVWDLHQSIEYDEDYMAVALNSSDRLRTA
jgi:hypothetical protein